LIEQLRRLEMTQKFLEWVYPWVTPRHYPIRTEDLRRARVFLMLLLGLCGFAALLMVWTVLSGTPAYIILPTFVGIVIIYAIGRFLSYPLSKWLTLALFTSLILVIYNENFYPALTFGVVIFNTLLAAIVLNTWKTIAVTVLNVIILVLLLIFKPMLPAEDLTIGGMIFLTLLQASAIIGIALINELNTIRLRQQSDALRAGEDRFRGLLEASPEMIAVQASGKFLYINSSGVRLLGATNAEEIIGQDARQFIMEYGRSTIASQLKQVGTQETMTVNYRQTFRRLDGSFTEMLVTASTITYADQLATLITARDSATVSIATTAETAQDNALDHVPTTLFITDGDTLIYVNRQAEIVTGYTSDELKAMRLTQIFEEMDLSVVKERIQQQPPDRRISQEQTYGFLHKNGQRRLLWLKSHLVAYQGQKLLMSAGYDVTERAQKERDLRLVQTAAEHTLDAILITNADLDTGPYITYVNPAFCQMTGYAQDELIGKTPRLLQGPLTERQMIINLRRGLEKGEATSGEAINYRKDRSVYPVEWHIIPFRDEQNSVTHFISIQRDLTPVRRAEAEAHEREERYRMVTELITDYGYAMDVLPDGGTRIAWYTDALATLTGFTKQELNGFTNWRDVLYADDVALVERQYLAVLLTGKPATLEFRLKSRVTPPFCWIRDTARPVWDVTQQRYTRIYGAGHNITERMQAEDALRAHVVQQALVAELGLLALSETQHQLLFDHALVLAEQVLEVASCDIFAYDPDTHRFRLAATSHAETDKTLILEETPDASGVGYTLANREPVLVMDLTTETRFRQADYQREAGFVSSAHVVIHGNPQPYGVLSVHHTQQRGFSDDDVYFLQSIANVLGTFIDRQRAQDAEREQREFAEALQEITAILSSKLELAEVLPIVLQFVSQVVPGHEASTVMLIDDADHETIHFAASRGYDDPKYNFMSLKYRMSEFDVGRRITETQQPLIISEVLDYSDWVRNPHTEWIRSYVGAPIVVDGQTIGMINVDSRQPNAFTERDASRLMTFASKSGIAISNARRAEDLERKVAERTQELAIRHAQLQGILEASGEGVFYTEGYRIIFANRFAQEMTGYSAEDLHHKDVRLFASPDVEDIVMGLLHEMEAELRAGRVLRRQVQLRRRDGSLFDAALTVSGVGEFVTPYTRAVTIMRDISREKALEAKQARFIANAAHELRSPITNLNTRLYLLRRQPEGLAQHVDLLDRVIQRMNRLVSDLLDLSYFESGQINLQTEAVIAQDVVSEVALLQQAEADLKQIQLHCDLPLEPVHILADPHRLKQVFTNLIGNAIAYTPEGGAIHVTVEADVEPHQLVVRVRDTGNGIPRENLPDIFQPFYRVEKKQPGTGLGLSIAREIVELHGGTIIVESDVGQGSTFIVRLALIAE
jgi:PAS domain S-box-containing protein